MRYLVTWKDATDAWGWTECGEKKDIQRVISDAVREGCKEIRLWEAREVTMRVTVDLV